MALLPVAAQAAEPTPDAVGALEADRQRIQKHLATVEADLRAVDLAALEARGLDADQRDARLALIDELHSYWTTGEFPHNPVHSPKRPYFFDAEGRACAVGQLVVASGHGELAQAVIEGENTAYLLDMQTEGLVDWADTHGFTLLELARIQPSYCGCPQEEELVCGADGVTYANACVATECAGVEVAHEGACEGQEQDPGTWPEEAEDETETGGDDDDGEDESGGEDDDQEPDPRGCSVAGAGGDLEGTGWLGLLALTGLGLGLRRRRRPPC